jgi:prolyl-tRNA synthetase
MYSRMIEAIMKIFQEKGYIESYKVVENDGKKSINVVLKYDDNGRTVINEIKRISKPGRRVYKGKEEKVMDLVSKVFERLKGYGYRVVLDDSEDRPGAKYYRWELKGAAMRVEVGPREVEENSAVVSFRDERRKFKVSVDEITKDRIEEWAKEMKERMRTKAFDKMKTFVKYFDDVGELADWVGKGVGLIHLCSSPECGEKIEEEVKGSVLGRFEEIPEWVDKEYEGSCIVCGEKGFLTAIAKTY